MTDDGSVAGQQDVAAQARDAGCDAILLQSEDGAGAKTWHFSQHFDGGIRWKRMKWPWVALRASSNREAKKKKNFSKEVASAEAFLRTSHPEALVPLSLIKENLRESARLVDNDHLSASQGDLLALGMSKYTRVSGVGKQTAGQWRRLCLVFASGALRTNVGMALLRWHTRTEDSGALLRVPYLMEKSREDVRFTQPILQILFPASQDFENLTDYLAVRTATELDILTCAKDEDNLAAIHRRLRLPSPLADDPNAQYIANATLSPHAPQAACITDTGFWAVHGFHIRKGSSELVASGRLITPSLMRETPGVRWWKMEWNDPNNVFILENSGLYLLTSGESELVVAPDKTEQFRSFALINSLRGIALAVLTISEILIVDMLQWKVLIRQKHRRDPDSSLLMKIFASENVINILIYSNLNPLVTVHQVSEDLPVSWLDTPFELPLPRNDPAVPRMAANLGLVVIPSGTVLEKRENPPQIQDGSFTTYRLQPDLSIIGDLYGSQERGIERFTGRPFANGSESYSSHLTTTDADADSANEDDAWSPYRGTKVLDLSDIANEFVPSKPIPYPVEGRRTRYKLRNEVVDQILKTEFKYETLNRWNSDEMWKVDLDELSSVIEQIGHSLQEHRYRVHHLHVGDEQHDLDPEEDPGSVSYINKTLVSTIPKELDSSDSISKLRASREIATLVGLANVAVSKPPPANEQAPFSTLRQFHGLGPEISISEGSKFLLDTWGVAPEFEQAKTTVTPTHRPRKRVKFEDSPFKIAIEPSSQRDAALSQRDATPTKLGANKEVEISMSQPVRGKYGDCRRKFRKSGF